MSILSEHTCSHATPLLRRRHLAAFRTSGIAHRFTDVLVIGSGVSGLSAALAAAAEPGCEILVLAKDTLAETATRYAQGGIAAVVEPQRTGDSVERHIEDTLATGQGLTDLETARLTVTEGVTRVQEFLGYGVQFDRDDAGELQFTLEGGHSYPRILHRGDTTGHEIERVLLEQAAARPGISFLSNTFAIDLLGDDRQVTGALLWRPHGEFEAVWARQTILATGGLGRVYRETTNPAVATGDGVAMAFRAGAALEDLEFIQFHPTTLYLAGADRLLITEAVRGEGGVLRDSSGKRFMERFHAQADLAPRDVVSRGIIEVLRKRGENKVFLDFSPIPPARIQRRFPRILEVLRGFGIDILHEPVPVRPSAHYTLGGVCTDLEGRTSVPGLLAAGEVAATRLHGANRLASNSLLEGFVFGHRAGRQAAQEARSCANPQPHSVTMTPAATSGTSGIDLADLRTSLTSLLWHKVGLERSGEKLSEALEQITSWLPYGLGRDYDDVPSWTVQNMLLNAYLITAAALGREESRGVHFRSDFPNKDDARFRQHLSLSRDDLP